MSLYASYAPPPPPPKQQRVVADGWAASGSVFCADSSLRFLYEAQPQPPGSAAAAISSLASGDFKTLQPPPKQSMMAMNLLAAKLEPANATRGADGVDLFEAEIARACAAVTKQLPALPHSFRECSVCLTPNAYAQIAVCGHTFHSKCFLRWFRQNRSCPLCRGPVDKIQCAPVVSVQDELEALMAEMDEAEEPLGASDPLMENPDLISFLGTDFDDADMDMMPLDDVALGLDKQQHQDHHHHHHHSHDDDDVSMDDEDEQEQVLPTHKTISTFGMQLQMQTPPPPPPPAQFAPASTMPNYWNVLNQGLAMPPVMPTPIMAAPPQPSLQQQQQQHHRMVHIAPKPDGHVPAPHAHSHVYGHTQHAHPFASASRSASPAPAAAAAAAPRVVSCRCTGGCRNGRCACVKEGGMCGVACRCTSCKNPFLMVKAAGADIDALLKDACFMHNVSKTRDMVVRMQEPVEVPCCERSIKVIDCVQGYTCSACDRKFDFSWCMNKLLDHDKTPRNHCEICKRCCDHRDVHCNDCGRCYFAGVAASLPCPCKESSRKRRDPHADTTVVKEEAGADGEEKEGECSIM